ncbi:MAG: replication factor C small subunit [Candidatus Methanofastidiosa archaeon]|nr:replication factor C small subunit [Candidatus Methanofastidiosa archaeon]
MNFEKPWTEKYRPAKLDDVVGRPFIVERLKSYVERKNMPHLLFAGPAGVGKTTCALALAREMFGDSWHQNFQETNASDERGINVVRERIKDFARTMSIGGNFKIIFLDESDALTPDAQNALRRTMEIYTSTCRFILSCNYSSKIIPPIQSRCAIFRFGPLPDGAIEEKLNMIADNEKIVIKESGMEAIKYIADGDMRKAENTMQAAAFLGKDIDEDLVYQVSSRARPEEIVDMINAAISGNFLASRRLLDSLLIEKGLSGEDIITQVHRQILELELPEERKVDLIDKIGEHEFRLVEGSNERIQLEALLARLAKKQ